jgi:hypothetical protein
MRIGPAPPWVSTRAVTGVRSLESSTTRRGDGPRTSRVVSSGSSESMVPTPTSTASCIERSSWVTASAAREEMEVGLPRSAVRQPSALAAKAAVTKGPRASSSSRADSQSWRGKPWCIAPL